MSNNKQYLYVSSLHQGLYILLTNRQSAYRRNKMEYIQNEPQLSHAICGGCGRGVTKHLPPPLIGGGGKE
jgi:hypothetical protein